MLLKLSPFCRSQGSIRLVAGNTGYGIYKEWLPEDHLIDVKQVPEMRRLSLSKVRPMQQARSDFCSCSHLYCAEHLCDQETVLLHSFSKQLAQAVLSGEIWTSCVLCTLCMYQAYSLL